MSDIKDAVFFYDIKKRLEHFKITVFLAIRTHELEMMVLTSEMYVFIVGRIVELIATKNPSFTFLFIWSFAVRTTCWQTKICVYICENEVNKVSKLYYTYYKKRLMF